MEKNGDKYRTIKAGDRLLSVVELLQAEGGAGVTLVADRLGIAKSTAHAYLKTLQNRRYVVKRGDSYHVGLRFLELGQTAKQPWNSYELIEQKVEELAAESQIRAQFLVEEYYDAVYVYRATSRHSVPTNSRIGYRIPLHAVAAGKAMLAEFPSEYVAAYLENRKLEQQTEKTITDRQELQRQLERIRERGYAVNEGESWEGVSAVGAPILHPDGEVIGGLSISGSSHRIDPEEFAELVMGAANEIKLNIKYR